MVESCFSRSLRRFPGFPLGEILTTGTQKGPNCGSAYAMGAVIEQLQLGKMESLPSVVARREGTTIFFGGPYNNRFSRAVLGTGEGSPLLKILGGADAGALPVMFDLKNKVALYGMEPTWGVRIHGVADASLEDCLLLTVIPDPYSPTAKASDRIVIVAGRHRAGMIALKWVLADVHLLRRLTAETRNLEAWQALIPVLTTDQQTPKGLGEPRVFQVRADFDRLRMLVRHSAFLSNPLAPEYDELFGMAFLEPGDADGRLPVLDRASELASVRIGHYSHETETALRGSESRPRTVSPPQELLCAVRQFCLPRKKKDGVAIAAEI